MQTKRSVLLLFLLLSQADTIKSQETFTNLKYTFIWLLAALILFGCEKDTLNTLSVSRDTIDIPADGGTASFTIQTDADSWSIDKSDSEWLSISVTTGTEKEAEIMLTVENKTLTPRSDTLTVTAGNAKPVYVAVSQEASSYLYVISASITEITFEQAGGTVEVEVSTDATAWNLHTEEDWIQLSDTQGGQAPKTIAVTVPENETTDNRTAVLIIEAEQASPVEITVMQDGLIYPSYNTNPIAPDPTGMPSTATELADRITVGWNIGNTLEAIGGETAWGNPMVTEELIQMVKQNGFNAIRIPCSWNQHIANSATAEIKVEWLNRVRQVVEYCVDNDMYVLLNIHWDGGWLENNVTVDKQKEVNAKQKAFWEQIATHLRDFDERLMFASANEPHVENSTQMEVLESYHQTFIDAVRSTGGRNSHRVLVVQGPSTDVEKTNNLMASLPQDAVEDRLMVEIHYYTPFQFCLMTEDASWGEMFYYWGNDYHSTTNPDRNATWGQEAKLAELMGMMRSQFVDNGIPVVLGEYAAIRRASLTGENLELHLASRAHFLRYLNQQARANGLLTFYWDAGNMGNNASALFDRRNYTIYDQKALDAIIEGAGVR